MLARVVTPYGAVVDIRRTAWLSARRMPDWSGIIFMPRMVVNFALVPLASSISPLPYVPGNLPASVVIVPPTTFFTESDPTQQRYTVPSFPTWIFPKRPVALVRAGPSVLEFTPFPAKRAVEPAGVIVSARRLVYSPM
jgi:hypothetical protein